MVYYVLTMLVLVYATSNNLTALLQDIFLSAWVNYVMYKFLLFGHVVGVGIIVLDSLFAPQPIGQGARPVANNETRWLWASSFRSWRCTRHTSGR